MKLTIALLSLVLVCAAPATRYRAEPTNGSVSFSITKWGVFEEQGTFRDFSATIVLDREHRERSTVEFLVQAASVDTKNADRDGNLRSVDFLDVARYPTWTFRSVRVVPRGNNAADVTGDLTIHGVTRRVTVPVRLVATTTHPRLGELASFDTAFSIDRRDFHVTGGRWAAGAPGILGNDVKVHIVAGGVSR